MKLTNIQKQVLLLFFKNDDTYKEWKKLAETLLDNGSCIIPKKDRLIWVGGIGNYITVEDAEGAIDCQLYKFDLEGFLNSNWCKDSIENYIIGHNRTKLKIELELAELTQLIISQEKSKNKPSINIPHYYINCYVELREFLQRKKNSKCLCDWDDVHHQEILDKMKQLENKYGSQ